MVNLIPLFQSTQNGDGILHAWLGNQHRLESSFQSGILFDILAVLVEGGRTDTVQLAAGKHWLEQVARIHRAFGLAGAHDGVQLINKEDDFALALFDFAQTRFQSLLKLAAEFGSCNQRTHIQ